MITLTIDDPELERTYHENFEGNDVAFVKFLSATCHVNNVDYDEDLSSLANEIYSADNSEDSGYTLDEAFDMLRNKHSGN